MIFALEKFSAYMTYITSQMTCDFLTLFRRSGRKYNILRSYFFSVSGLLLVMSLFTILIPRGNFAYAQSPLRIVFPQSAVNPLLITRAGYPAVKMFLPAHEQIVSHITVQGGASMYRAHNWCVLADPVIPSLDFGCDMNSASNPLTEAALVWPPKIFTIDFVLPPQWFMSAVDPTVFANTGRAVPIKDQTADQIGIFAPGTPAAPLFGFLPAPQANPINIMTIQAYARCDFQAYYHMRIHAQQIIVDQNQTTQNCHPRFPPLIQL